MSATADAGLFASYFETALGQPSGQLTIPGFTHPVTGNSMMRGVARLGSMAAWQPGSIRGNGGLGKGQTLPRQTPVPEQMLSVPAVPRCACCTMLRLLRWADMFLEDALEATGFLVGKTSKWAKRSGSGNGGGSGGGGGAKKKGGDADGGASMLGQGYSEQTRQSLANIDEAMVNTDLIEALVAQVLGSRQRQQQPEGAGGGGKRGGGGDDASAILIFAPGGRPL